MEKSVNQFKYTLLGQYFIKYQFYGKKYQQINQFIHFWINSDYCSDYIVIFQYTYFTQITQLPQFFVFKFFLCKLKKIKTFVHFLID
ncbi:hypothetical protein TTHERM_000785921 (macronuclear) [Tetrahymena thermophila SB210]|uniref:Uncharacterized protein n=1 Tax=Tetrahymena thermophila (strain SB210) TaxID=312017 RepID=W7X5V6_TETTS|nr:hypothetical protein TTHERM_000785921 [Tetrahymena thermophila SB210]EWS72782.1 hypothetical protein TTHERM_000785921 [Tetrahymena thermophila SB210]|eukprot:XP_012654669.1 hypothetical protein TTHERM_000785921 [Tetrahymena thermophila SB210]